MLQSAIFGIWIEAPVVGFLRRLIENSHKKAGCGGGNTISIMVALLPFFYKRKIMFLIVSAPAAIILGHVRAAHPLVLLMAPQKRQFGKGAQR